ncbi:MAG: hypothetical protein NTV01_08415 [Bacteroidia bacterium]|nr:hypothetical protein [Bacteroidia bacterium]
MKRKFLTFLVLLIGGTFFSQAVFAAGASLGISPVTFELTGRPGEVIENYLKVFNPSGDTIGVKMEIEDIAPTGEEGFVTVEPPDTETYSLARWIKTDPEEFELKPGEERQVKFTLTIPESAEPGGHYGTVLAATRAIIGSGNTGAAIVQRIGALVLLIVPGEMQENLIVKDFSAPIFSEHGPINFSIKFENTGTVHVKPKGLITINNLLGRKSAVIPFPEKNVLPGGIRKIDTSWDKKWLWPGRYTAIVTGNYGISNAQMSPMVITFWVFPWKIGIVVLLFLVLLFLIRKRFIAAFKILIRGEK